jgi:hypothetical protein
VDIKIGINLDVCYWRSIILWLCDWWIRLRPASGCYWLTCLWIFELSAVRIAVRVKLADANNIVRSGQTMQIKPGCCLDGPACSNFVQFERTLFSKAARIKLPFNGTQLHVIPYMQLMIKLHQNLLTIWWPRRHSWVVGMNKMRGIITKPDLSQHLGLTLVPHVRNLDGFLGWQLHPQVVKCLWSILAAWMSNIVVYVDVNPDSFMLEY